MDKVDKQLKKLKRTETYINITGIHYYQGFTPFNDGRIVDLIKEPDNHYDMNAILLKLTVKR